MHRRDAKPQTAVRHLLLAELLLLSLLLLHVPKVLLLLLLLLRQRRPQAESAMLRPLGSEPLPPLLLWRRHLEGTAERSGERGRSFAQFEYIISYFQRHQCSTIPPNKYPYV